MLKRSIATLGAAAMLVAVLAAPAAAAPAKTSPLVVTTACVTALDEMDVRTDWTNEPIDPLGENLFITWPFTATHIGTYQFSTNFTGPWGSSGTVEQVWIKATDQNGATIDWNRWSSIGTVTSYAFFDTAKTIKQPHGGWPAC
jgi:hypothetical protein